MRPDPLDDLVGPTEIAKRLDVAKSTVAMWQLRSKAKRPQALPFPKPVKRVSGRTLFSWRQVRAWAESTGRPVTNTEG